jgi:hypothetical protein
LSTQRRNRRKRCLRSLKGPYSRVVSDIRTTFSVFVKSFRNTQQYLFISGVIALSGSKLLQKECYWFLVCLIAWFPIQVDNWTRRRICERSCYDLDIGEIHLLIRRSILGKRYIVCMHQTRRLPAWHTKYARQLRNSFPPLQYSVAHHSVPERQKTSVEEKS